MSRPGNQGAALDRAERDYKAAKAAKDAVGRRPFSQQNERDLRSAEKLLRLAEQQLDRAHRAYGR